MLHVETGISRADFDELDGATLAALQDRLMERQKRELRREAGLYALLCNLLGGGKKTVKPEDFLPENFDGEIDPEKAAAALAKYHEAQAAAAEEGG